MLLGRGRGRRRGGADRVLGRRGGDRPWGGFAARVRRATPLISWSVRGFVSQPLASPVSATSRAACFLATGSSLPTLSGLPRLPPQTIVGLPVCVGPDIPEMEAGPAACAGGACRGDDVFREWRWRRGLAGSVGPSLVVSDAEKGSTGRRHRFARGWPGRKVNFISAFRVLLLPPFSLNLVSTFSADYATRLKPVWPQLQLAPLRQAPVRHPAPTDLAPHARPQLARPQPTRFHNGLHRMVKDPAWTRSRALLDSTGAGCRVLAGHPARLAAVVDCRRRPQGIQGG